MKQSRASGFTLIELMVAISLSVIILGAVYFSLNAALESWRYSRNELALQQVISSLMAEVLEGTQTYPGLRAALEITEAEPTQFRFVQPWVEEQIASTANKPYTLAQYVKPGSGLPTAEFRWPGTTVYRPISVAWDNPDALMEHPRVRPLDLEAGSTVRFSYHPDPQRVPESVITVRWDKEKKAIFVDTAEGTEQLGKNIFGVQVTGCRFQYYDHHNKPYTESMTGRQSSDLELITAVEVEITGTMGDRHLTLMGMAMLRNSSRQSGLVILKEDLEVQIPSSKKIKTLLLTNLTGISPGDEIQLEIHPHTGKVYRVTVLFEQYGKTRPVFGEITVEYPIGQAILTERPRTSADLGLDLLTLGSNGLYDYDDDPHVEDFVSVDDEPVTLTVTKSDVGGASIFLRP